jgi:succinate-acetate transporter protein
MAPQVQSVADPAPLGLAAFGLTTFILSAVNAGLIPKPAEPGLITAIGAWYVSAITVIASTRKAVK